ncbi:hypothetical protein DPEC_G00303660 [Dallia pectoralis]|uniref:Uncharacterized protein n=1 Tax=Dallia pectoralis TaxID=75939 RepID=A0ACC2FDC8_DALPE|nr:hypothetical protein DPEC_G00303660 [Dallia pectoralis]
MNNHRKMQQSWTMEELLRGEERTSQWMSTHTAWLWIEHRIQGNGDAIGHHIDSPNDRPMRSCTRTPVPIPRPGPSVLGSLTLLWSTFLL